MSTNAIRSILPYFFSSFLPPFLGLFFFFSFAGNLVVKCVGAKSFFSCVWLCATLWTAAHQAPLSIVFSRQEYWIGMPCPPLGDLPHLRIKLTSLALSPALQVYSLPLSHWGSPLTPLGNATLIGMVSGNFWNFFLSRLFSVL